MNAEPNVSPTSIESSAPAQGKSRDYYKVNSLPSASILAFTGASLDAFLYLNHGHVFAGVMTGNAVLCGVSVLNKSSGGALHYAWPILAYVCGIWLVATAQKHLRHDPVRYTLGFVLLGYLALSFVPETFPEKPYVFLVVLLTGFLVGISKKVASYSYNATVLTGTLRDATLSFYNTLNPELRAQSLQKGRDLGTLILAFFAGAVAGGLLGRHFGNHVLWLPVATLAIVLMLVVRGGSNSTGFDEGRRLASRQSTSG